MSDGYTDNEDDDTEDAVARERLRETLMSSKMTPEEIERAIESI